MSDQMNNHNMSEKNVCGLYFNPYVSYHRKYVNHLFKNNSEYITGKVLDIGAKTDERERYERIAEFDDYFSLDIVRRDGTDLNLLADAANLPIKSNSFDTVIMSEVIEHIPPLDIKKVFQEAKRILCPDGTLLLSSPFIYPLHGMDFQRFTTDGIATALDQVGFENIETIRGGNYSESLLHLLYHPICFDVVPKFGFGTRHFGWIYAPVHYLIIGLSKLPWGYLSKDPPHLIEQNNMYITNFCIAHMSSESTK